MKTYETTKALVSSAAAILLLSSWNLPGAHALDVEITGFDCDGSLYVKASSFSVMCDGSNRCTFGSSIANVSGALYYDNVDKSGIVDNTAYLTTDIELMSLNYKFHEMMPIPLCTYMTNSGSNNNNCPGDGKYLFSVDYRLPQAGGGGGTSWMASGWEGLGTMTLYAEQDENMKIGQCQFSMKTYVTKDPSKGIFQAPSAAASIGMFFGAVALTVLLCVYLKFCRQRAKRRKGDPPQSFSKDEISTMFKRLDDDQKSQILNSASKSSQASNHQIDPPVVKLASTTKSESDTDDDSEGGGAGEYSPPIQKAPTPMVEMSNSHTVEIQASPTLKAAMEAKEKEELERLQAEDEAREEAERLAAEEAASREIPHGAADSKKKKSLGLLSFFNRSQKKKQQKNRPADMAL